MGRFVVHEAADEPEYDPFLRALSTDPRTAESGDSVA